MERKWTTLLTYKLKSWVILKDPNLLDYAQIIFHDTVIKRTCKGK